MEAAARGASAVYHGVRQSRPLKVVLSVALLGGLLLYLTQMMAATSVGTEVLPGDGGVAASPEAREVLRQLAELSKGRAGEGEGDNAIALLRSRLEELAQGKTSTSGQGSSSSEARFLECQADLTACQEGKDGADVSHIIKGLRKEKEYLERQLKERHSSSADSKSMIAAMKTEKELLQAQLRIALEGKEDGGSQEGVGALEAQSLKLENKVLKARLLKLEHEGIEGGEVEGGKEGVKELQQKVDRLEKQLADSLESSGKAALVQGGPDAPEKGEEAEIIATLNAENTVLKAQVKDLESKSKDLKCPDCQGNKSITLQTKVLELERKLKTETSALKGEVKELEKQLKTFSSGQGDENLKKKVQVLEDALAEAQKDKGTKESLKEVEEMKKKMSDTETLYDRVMTEKRALTRKVAELSSNTTVGTTVDSDKMLEAAKKAVEECGKKQGDPSQQAVSKLYQCEATDADLKRYLNYKPRQQCPDDWYFIQDLIYVKNCFCLPRRRCFAPMPPSYIEPTIPFPQSLFEPKVLRNENVRWTRQYWPSYEGILSRKLGDCRDCFNLTLESKRWENNFRGTLTLEKFLKLKNKGALKVGLDAGGGSGSFAAKMAQHGITIVTTAMNTETLGDREGGLPYMETIAQRGLIPLHVPHKARQPFFDGTLDLIHAINSIKYFSVQEFEELLFEWDRILRPGGVLWFELFYTSVEEMPLYIAVLNVFDYKKLYWKLAPKTDAPEKDGEHVYLNCVLEKPRRPDPVMK